MISNSCIKLVEIYFKSIDGVEIKSVFLGEVILTYNREIITALSINNHFKTIGFEVIKDPDIILFEKIKIAAIELIIFSNNNNSIIRNSDYIRERVQEPYDKISKVFSKIAGITLEKYIILLKIEKAKELILEDQLTLSEISYQLGYSSVQYLSRQFKQITTYTFSDYKALENPPRRILDDLV